MAGISRVKTRFIKTEAPLLECKILQLKSSSHVLSMQDIHKVDKGNYWRKCATVIKTVEGQNVEALPPTIHPSHPNESRNTCFVDHKYLG